MRHWIIALVLGGMLLSPAGGTAPTLARVADQGQISETIFAEVLPTKAVGPATATPTFGPTTVPTATGKRPATATATVGPATATATPTPTRTATRTPTPRSDGAQIKLTEVQPETGELEISLRGFGRREWLTIWLTRPDEQAVPLPDRQTGVDGGLTFVERLPRLMRGEWAITVQGQITERRVVARFQVGWSERPIGVSSPTPTMTGNLTPVATITPTVTPTATPTVTPTVTPTPTPRGRPKLAHLMPPPAPGGTLSLRLRQTYFGNAARLTGVPVEVLLAVAAVESGYSPHAIGPYLPQFAGTEDEHALGMMQFLPSTYRLYMRAVDRVTGKNLGLFGLWDPESSVYAAAFYLRDSGAPSRMRQALLRYNNAEWYVDLVLAWADYYAKGGGLGSAPRIDRATIMRMRDPAVVAKPTETPAMVSEAVLNRELERQFDSEMLAFWLALEQSQTTWIGSLGEHRALAQ